MGQTRAFLACLFIVTALASVVATGSFIKYLLRHGIGQPIRKEGNKAHYKKQGTPTMGGIAFTAVALAFSAATVGFKMEFWLLLVGTVGFGLIGFLDDYEKVSRNQNEGLTPKQKLALQGVLSLALIGIVYAMDAQSWLRTLPWGWLLVPVYVFVIVGTTNAVNLTDGLDGLLAGVSIPVFITIALIATMGRFMNINVERMAVIFAASLLGYLFYNANPASVMMGDTGSMAIGGALCALLLPMNLLLLLAILGGVYVMETLSVMIQVQYFRRTGGKRIFLMSPIHHHFELKGYAEQKITVSFTALSVLLCAVSVAIASLLA